MTGFFGFALALIAVLLLASLSGYVSERAGVVNIGIEGMMTMGALILSIIGGASHLGALNQIWAIFIAAAVGGVFALLHGFASITLKSNQVISGTAINILASGVALFVATAGTIGGDATDIATKFTPLYCDSTHVLPVWLVVAVGFTILLFLFFKFTKWGMRYKMVGENPNAVDAAGISVVKYRYIAVFLSGAIAGFGGAIMVCSQLLNAKFQGTTMGYGFLGLAILIFGQWNILYITLGTIVFGFLLTLGFQLGTIAPSGSGISTNGSVFKVVPFVLTIIMMIIFSKWSHAPAADGEPFDKALR